jgi:hypothetical protein
VMAPAMSVRVKRGHRARSNPRGYVCVEALQSANKFAIYFFRHADGSWCVFPPDLDRPAMGIH